MNWINLIAVLLGGMSIGISVSTLSWLKGYRNLKLELDVQERYYKQQLENRDNIIEYYTKKELETLEESLTKEYKLHEENKKKMEKENECS